MTSELSQEQLDAQRQALRQRREELLRDVRDELLKSDDQTYIELAGRVHDSGEAAVADLLADTRLAVIDHHIEAVREVEAALERLEQGQYGRCEECGTDIPLARLQAQPAARRCVACQERYEKVHAGEGHSSL